MTLEAFIHDMEEKLNGFKKMWEAGEPKEHFPNQLGEGDWIEQLLFFIEEEDRRKGKA